ncbi:MAG: peptidase T [Oscillospiraceae bacterium]|nr:peptidase T [Oscillospiraceae bacterium]
MNVLDRFLKYVSFDTGSDSASKTIPSTAKQKKLGEFLVAEMQAMGIFDARMDAFGYVYGSIPANTEKLAPKIGLIAHMDTVSDVPCKNIKPRVVENYDGGDILLNAEKHIVLSPKEYPDLLKYVGGSLVVTDGTTLLGADDKAGIAEILAAAEALLSSHAPHGEVKIAFTPDEEIGRGPDQFDVPGFGADYGYTVDGGELGELEYENFNGADGRVIVHGRNIHPGTAKGQMVNAQLLAMEFASLLPAAQIPAHTEGYEGFFHLTDMKGDVEQAELTYIIRDHDKAKYEEKKRLFCSIGAFLNEKYGAGTFEVSAVDRYANMKEKILPHMEIIERAQAAMQRAGVQPKVQPIRGGTDGATLSFMGLPCPNLCTGGHNFHGRFEYIPVESMEKVAEILLHILYSAVL